MTELIAGVLRVRCETGVPAALLTSSGWRAVLEVANRWRVETDWWRASVRRDYFRCLLSDGECLDVYQDLDSGGWHGSRRHD